METIQHNLARKWRSRHFDGIIGQPLPVKVLKNSLYLGQFFPVYLFAGQRGCGKTSTARVFAAAVNCEQLPAFRKEPRSNPVPCTKCSSCLAMQKGAHPDYVEIDAASHTGVDNVRALIEAASFLPVMGKKKIYLIDEAHMLSKAAFNALLKIMEEPPEAVVFMLATTDPEKIIETVRSRCFQLVFKPVDQKVLVDHLASVCAAEKIGYEIAGLETIVRASEGSVRDALNMIDQARFSSGKITKASVQAALGSLDDERLLTLLSIVLTKSPRDLLTYMQQVSLEHYSADHVWHALVQLVRQVLWLKHGVEPKEITCDKAQLKRIAAACSWARLNKALDSLYAAEQLFSKTTAQHAVLEMILLQLCSGEGHGGNDSGPAGMSASPALADELEEVVADELEEDGDAEEDDEEEVPESDHALWNGFLMELNKLDEPLLISIFKQGSVKSYDKKGGVLEVEFSKRHLFFGEWLNETRAQWESLLHREYGAIVTLKSLFTGPEVAIASRRQQEKRPEQSAMPTNTIPAKAVSAKAAPSNKGVYPVLRQGRADFRKQPGADRQPFAFAHEPVLDVSNETVWAKAAMIKRYFPGECREVRERV